jgi:hypothetical protein
MGLKIEREKTALMNVNKKSATLMPATKASDKIRSILEVSDEKVRVVGKVLCKTLGLGLGLMKQLGGVS